MFQLTAYDKKQSLEFAASAVQEVLQCKMYDFQITHVFLSVLQWTRKI
jgi:hypothetical protein